MLSNVDSPHPKFVLPLSQGFPGGRVMRIPLTLAVAAAFAFGNAEKLRAGANAVELKLFCADVMRPALIELIPAFERTSRHNVSLDLEPAGVIRKGWRGCRYCDHPADRGARQKRQVC